MGERIKDVTVGERTFRLTKLASGVAMPALHYVSAIADRDPKIASGAQAYLMALLAPTIGVVGPAMVASDQETKIENIQPFKWDDLDLSDTFKLFNLAQDFQFQVFSKGSASGSSGPVNQGSPQPVSPPDSKE